MIEKASKKMGRPKAAHYLSASSQELEPLVPRHWLGNLRLRGRAVSIAVSVRFRQRSKRDKAILRLHGLFFQHHFAIQRSHARVVSLIVLLRPTRLGRRRALGI